MKRTADPLVTSVQADRLNYSTGELLGADDFRAEQTYHRRQLARALLHLYGSGVIAGLRVFTHHRPGENGALDEVELEVEPGLALDHTGRLVEVPRQACLRLRRWFSFIAARTPSSTELDAGDLRLAWRADGAVAAGGAVVADVFLAFHPCPRGYTPAFASGPFDALDASQPSRVRDGYELSLVLRTEADGDLPVASDPWAAIAGGTAAERLASAEQRAFELWRQSAEPAPPSCSRACGCPRSRRRRRPRRRFPTSPPRRGRTTTRGSTTASAASCCPRQRYAGSRLPEVGLEMTSDTRSAYGDFQESLR
jgi:hypothetical protein